MPHNGTARALETASEQARDALIDALVRNEIEVWALLDAARDFNARAATLTVRLRDTIAREQFDSAARVASALAAVARLAESRVLAAVERRRAALEIGDELLDAVPAGRTAWRRKREAVQQARRRRKAAA